MIGTRVCSTGNGSNILLEYYEFIFNPFHVQSATIKKIEYIDSDDSEEDYDPGVIELTFKNGIVVEIIYDESIYLTLKKMYE